MTDPPLSPFEQFRRKPTKAEPRPTPAADKARPEIWADWTAEWLNYYSQEPTRMTCLLPQIDADQEHNLKGKLAVLIGSGGSRKSYGIQNIVAHNILGLGCRGLYSSMEMGKPEVVNRMLDIVIQPEGLEPASVHLRRMVREDKDLVADYLSNEASVMDDRLVLDNSSGRTTQDYERLLDEAEAAYGPVDFLAIDGLSAMGGSGKDENERYSRITLELKELAKKRNIFIALICHTTKEAKPYTRDSRPFVRGSEKILDNSDFSICFSNIIDVPASTPDNVLYVPFLAHIKYYNKRGSGLMFNQLMEFSGLTKSFTPSTVPLLNFPDYDSFSREYNAKMRQAERERNPIF